MQSASAPTGRLGRKTFRGLYSHRGDQLRSLIKEESRKRFLVLLFRLFSFFLRSWFRFLLLVRHVDPAKSFEQIARDFRTDCGNRRVHYVGTGSDLLETA